MSAQRFPCPNGWELVIFVAGKTIFSTVAFGISLLFHSVGAVLIYYVIAGLVAGTVLSVVFQVAHCVEKAEFPLLRSNTTCFHGSATSTTRRSPRWWKKHVETSGSSTSSTRHSGQV